ncbi:MAG: VWA domain-containing protein [Archaeoglobaceae archaeon]
MKDDGVSMILEYLILTSILAFLVLLMSLNLNYVLEETQIAKVVENQFSDISAQISSQIVDMMAVYPKNGNISGRVFMPQKIGDIEYSVVLEGNQIKIVSEDDRFSKFLSLGVISDLGMVNLGGLTHSLKESHELVYQKISCIYPSAVLKVGQQSFIIPATIEIDVSDSSPGSTQNFEWRIIWWNNTSTTWYDGSTTKNLNLNINSWSQEFEQSCSYDPNRKFALCNITLEVRIFCEGLYLNSTAKRTIIIAKPETEGFGNLSVDKFVIPSQLEVGQTAYLHIRLSGIGLSGGKVVNLTSVLTLDTSGSMGNLSLIGNNVSRVLELSTPYQRLSGSTDNNKKGTVSLTLPADLDNYSFIAVRIPDQYTGFTIEKIGDKNCAQKCECTIDRIGREIYRKLCYITNVNPGSMSIEISGPEKNASFEVEVYLAKIDSLKISAIRYLKSLKEGDFSGLVEYDDKAVAKIVNSSQYLKYLTTNKTTIVEEVRKIVADGATNIYHALWKANQTLHENTTIINGTIPLIIFMTDGKPTVEANLSKSTCEYYCRWYDGRDDWDCPLTNWWFSEDGIDFCRYGDWCRNNCYAQLEELAENIKQIKIGDENIRICTIGFGREGEYNATLLRNMASYINETTKCYFDARNHDELQKAFRTIKNYFDIVATNVTITDVLPSYVEIDGEVNYLMEGLPVCNDTLTLFTDDENRTIIQFNCSQIRVGDSLEIRIPIRINEAGTYVLNVPQISNVTYYDINHKLITLPLEVVNVRYGSAESAQVIIK